MLVRVGVTCCIGESLYARLFVFLGVPGLRGTTWLAPRGTFGYFSAATGEASITGERLRVSSFGGVSSSESDPSSSNEVTEASDARLPPLDGALDALRTLEFERLDVFRSVLRSLSDRRNVAGPMIVDEGRAALLTESLLEDSGLGLRVRAYLFAALRMSDGELAMSFISFSRNKGGRAAVVDGCDCTSNECDGRGGAGFCVASDRFGRARGATGFGCSDDCEGWLIGSTSSCVSS